MVMLAPAATTWQDTPGMDHLAVKPALDRCLQSQARQRYLAGSGMSSGISIHRGPGRCGLLRCRRFKWSGRNGTWGRHACDDPGAASFHGRNTPTQPEGVPLTRRYPRQGTDDYRPAYRPSYYNVCIMVLQSRRQSTRDGRA